MAGDEGGDLVRDGQGADAAVVRSATPVLAEVVAGLDQGRSGSSRRRSGRRVPPRSPSMTGAGSWPRAVSSLRRQAVEVPLPVLGALAVARLLVVAGPPGEVGRQGVLGAGDRPVADAVAVDVAVALELPEPFQVVGVEHLAASEGLLGIGERVGQPEVHPEVEVGGDEDRGLELLGEVQRLDRQRVALADRARDQDDVPAVAVARAGGA